ncbi:hypothetical protein [Sphingopyxis sp. C-1]|nr:hypothetical protein [Sphingopyxis sp. C-1]
MPFFVVHLWLALDAVEDGRSGTVMLHTSLSALAFFFTCYFGGAFK